MESGNFAKNAIFLLSLLGYSFQLTCFITKYADCLVGVMAKVLAQSTIVPALVTSRSHGLSKESGKSKRSAKMMCSLQTPGLRIRSFSGLRGSNSLDNMVSFDQDFRSKVAISISSRRGRGSRCVPKAMFERFT